MAANSSVVLTQLDFDSQRESLKSYLKGQPAFKDYNFEGSNMAVLLDILAYNTYLNTFYLNMVSNEMFLDSAKLRESVVSHAKELNYLPRSFSSAVAKIDMTITPTNSACTSLVIPKGTSFVSRVGSNNYTFSTDQDMVLTSGNGVFNTSELNIYEGTYLSETYTVNYNVPLVYKINNKTVDISSVLVTVLENNGSTQVVYQRATSLFGLDAESKVFFIQPSTNGSYEIVFGDGVIGRKPKNNSIAIIEYRVCSGELPNGAKTFIPTSKIDGETNIVISTVSPATNGLVAEDLNSIKYNAPRAFTTQERAITAEDYENLLKLNFPEINAVSAYGGEDATPPQYGRVFISVDLKDVDGLPKIKQNEYTNFLRTRSSVAMEPVFISPDYIYLNVDTKIKYNINITSRNPEDIRTSVISSILEYASNNLSNFNRTLRYSRLVKEIDVADNSIVSNETTMRLVKYLTPNLNVSQSFNIDFRMPLINEIPYKGDEHPIIYTMGVTSSKFSYAGINNCNLEDNGIGGIMIVTSVGTIHKKIADVGYVDYDTGMVTLSNFNISSFSGTSLKVYATPRYKDITSSQNVILNILEPDVSISIEQIRE